jgi:predicted amidophosphoribosyltransferase
LLLARALAKKSRGISVANILVSGRDRKDQVLLSPKERVENLEAAFRVTRNRPVEVPVILLDDVLTTGATLNEAYRTLTDSGVKVDGFCVFAQTGPRNPSK